MGVFLQYDSLKLSFNDNFPLLHVCGESGRYILFMHLLPFFWKVLMTFTSLKMCFPFHPVNPLLKTYREIIGDLCTKVCAGMVFNSDKEINKNKEFYPPIPI